MRTISLLMLCILSLAMHAQVYSTLDEDSPIAWQGSTISYRDRTIALDEKTFFVDGRLTEAQAAQSPYVFNNVLKALDATTNGSKAKYMTIYIAPYVYWIDNPDDPTVRKPQRGMPPIGYRIECDYLHLVGLTEKPQNVVLASRRGQTQGADGNFTMFYYAGNHIRTENLTFGNYCNVDLEFPLMPSLNRPKRSGAITQAQLVICNSDEVYCRNTNFISRLNLCNFAGAKRALFEDCHLECTDDALCSTGIYRRCSFDFYASKPFYTTSGAGAVFIDCDFNIKHDTPQYLTKVKGQVAIINCRWHAPSGYHQPIGWTQDPTPDLKYYQSGISLNGQPFAMQLYYPQSTVDITDTPLQDAFSTGNLWGNKGSLPVMLRITPAKAEIESPASVRLTAEQLLPNMQQTDKDLVHWLVDSREPVRLSAQTGNTIEVTGTNEWEYSKNVVITARTGLGLEAAVELNVLPAYLPSPAFVRKPVIVRDRDDLTVKYELDLQGRDDQSLITWYRCTSPTDAHPIPVAVSNNNNPLKTYKLTAADAGYYIKVGIEPKHRRSHAGDAVFAVTAKPIGKSGLKPDRQLSIRFANFPTAWQPCIIDGCWTVDAYKPAELNGYAWQPVKDKASWYYGTGEDGMRQCEGLVQATRGARLLYTPLPGKYGDMTVDLMVAVGKTAGQGFASAIGQYMEIYIKYDTRTQTGYGVRIERVPEYSDAVVFTLMNYKNGVPTALTTPTPSRCYRTNCHIILSAKGNKLLLKAMRGADIIDLSADIAPNDFGGLGIQHTGGTGSAATMLETLDVSYL